jgi:hypothetical protein
LLADGGSLADALPPYFGGCFATVVVLFGGCFATYGYFELGGCFAAIPLGFAAMVVLFGGCFAHHLLLRVGDSFFVQVQLFGWSLFGWLVWSVLPLRVSSVVCGRL